MGRKNTKQYLTGLIVTLFVTVLGYNVFAQTIQAESFRNPTRTATISLPSVTGTDQVMTVSATQTVRNKTLSSPTLNTPTINTATVSGGSFTSPTLNTPTINTATVSGGTFASPTLNTPTINTATVSGGTISGGVFQNGTVSGSTTLSGTMTGGTLSGPTLDTPTASTYVQFTDQGSDVAAPSAGSTRLYFKSTGLFYRTSSGVNTIAAQETGTCTITVVGSTTAGTGTYSQQLCAYRKTGTLVTVGVYVDITAHTGTGNILFGGMPYTSASTYYHSAAIGDITRMTLTGASWRPHLYLAPSSTQLVAVQSADAVGSTTVTMDTSFGILFTITYFTN